MKVIFITHENYHMPGARVRCYAMAEELAREGVDASVFSFHDRFGKPYAQLSDTEMMLNVARAYRILAQEPRDTAFFVQRINYHTLAPYLVSRAFGHPLILDCDDWDFDAPIFRALRYLPGFDALSWLDTVARSAAFCVASSHGLEAELKPLNSRVFMLPTGVNTAKFRPPTASAVSGAPRDKVKVSWLGTVFRRDNIRSLQFAIRTFARAASAFPDCCLEIVSTGNLVDEIRQQALEKYAGVDIRFLPWRSPDEIPAYLGSIDIGLLPLIPDNRFNRCKSPTKLFEYLACGRATVSSRVGEAEFVVRDGVDGILADTEERFADGLLSLLRDERRRREMGESARRRVESEFSHDIMKVRLLDCFRQWLS